MLLSGLIEGAPSCQDLTGDPLRSCGILLGWSIHVLCTPSVTVYVCSEVWKQVKPPGLTAVVHEPSLNGVYDPVGADPYWRSPAVGWSCWMFCRIVQVGVVAASTKACT